MTVNREELLSAIEAVKKPLAAAVTNARMGRVRLVRRVRNEDESPVEEIVDEGPVEEGTDDVAEVGDTVVIEPSDGAITGEVVEVVEEPAEEDGIETVEEEPVTNRRRYRRIRNARILRNADGTRDVVVPIDPRRVTNLRRYKTRTVTRNAGLGVDGTYAKEIPTPDAASWATTVNKARKYDEMLLNASIEQSIEEALKKALNKNGINNSSKPCSNSRTAPKVARFRKYRGVRNEDGSVSIEVNLGDAEEVTVPEVVDVPVVEDVPESDVAIEVNGYDVPLDNMRQTRRVQNRAVTKVVTNSECDGIGSGVLEVPTTFSPKR